MHDYFLNVSPCYVENRSHRLCQLSIPQVGIRMDLAAVQGIIWAISAAKHQL
jgi:hypothetical protein